MSDIHDPRSPHPAQQPLDVIPVRRLPPVRRSPLRWLGRFFFFLILAASLALNFILFVALIPGLSEGGVHIDERHYSGNALSHDKIAVVRVDGVLMEGMTKFAQKEIERAASDAAVKAVVLRINSPGGTITASDDLYQRLIQLRDGNAEKKTPAKPLVVSMASLAASGAYYISMPAKTLYAERTSITGSIGVYAAFPNATELANKIGFKMNVIKAGKVKDSGSPFHEMNPEEQEVWQTMVDHSYLQFLHVVEEGRPSLRGKLQEDIVIDETLPVRTDKSPEKHLKYTRYRADGGIFTADLAKLYGLIDQIGYLDDAIKEVKRVAGLAEDANVVVYERPATLFGSLLGSESQGGDMQLDVEHFSRAAMPRLWYLAPQSELAGLLAAAGRK
jgi:protease IV